METLKEILEKKFEELPTDVLIEGFIYLEKKNTSETSIINNSVMNEIEKRMPSDEFIALMESVYDV